MFGDIVLGLFRKFGVELDYKFLANGGEDAQL
jgi:hypothetical protein